MKKRVLAALMVLALCLGLAPNAASADVLTEDLPEIGAASYAIIDGDTQQVLFGNNYDKSYDPGTLVQMMTAVLIIEEGNLNDSVTVPEIPEAAIRSPAKMNAGIARKVNTLRARNAPMEIATLVPPCAR